MSTMRIGGGQTPFITPQAPKTKAPAQSSETEAPKPSVSPQVTKESFISSLSAQRQPPKMSLGTLMSEGPNAVLRVFADEIDELGRRSTEDVAADLAMTFINYSQLARREGDGDLDDAFNELGELMRGYEHIRMLKSGELG